MRIVMVLHDYYNERPETCYIDLDRLPITDPYRKAIEAAMSSRSKVAEISYADMESCVDGIVKKKSNLNIIDSVTLVQSV